MRETTPALYVYLDGREVCRPNTAGRKEYVRRRWVAWLDQGKVCGICHQPLRWLDAVTDHIRPRGHGGGFRDDRQHAIQATCGKCNFQKGSKRI